MGPRGQTPEGVACLFDSLGVEGLRSTWCMSWNGPPPDGPPISWEYRLVVRLPVFTDFSRLSWETIVGHYSHLYRFYPLG